MAETTDLGLILPNDGDSLLNGKPWGESVRGDFRKLEEVSGDLSLALAKEIHDRQEDVGFERAARESADTALSEKIDLEISTREKEDVRVLQDSTSYTDKAIFSNEDPKAGFLNRTTLPLYGLYRMAYVEGNGTTYADSEGKEHLFFRGSDGNQVLKLFQATKYQDFIFDNEPLHPPFLESGFTLLDVRGGSNDHLFFLSGDGTTYKSHIVKNSGNFENGWDNIQEITSITSSYSLKWSGIFDFSSNSITIIGVLVDRIEIQVYDATTLTPRGTLQTLFDFSTISYGTFTDGEVLLKSLPSFAYATSFNNLLGTFSLDCLYTDGGVRHKKTFQILLSHNLTSANLQDGLYEALPSNITSYSISSECSGLKEQEGSFTLSYDIWDERILLTQKSGYGFRLDQIPAQVFLNIGSLVSDDPLLIEIPEGCSWAKGISSNPLITKDRVYFKGKEWVSSKYQNGIELIPGEFYSLPEGIEEYSTKVDSNGNVAYYSCKGPGFPIQSVNFVDVVQDGKLLPKTLRVVNFGKSFPVLPLEYTYAGGFAYDPVGERIWCLAYKSSGTLEILNFRTAWTSYSNLGPLWDNLALVSKNAYLDRARPAQVSPGLLDANGRYYVQPLYDHPTQPSVSPVFRYDGTTLASSWQPLPKATLGYNDVHGYYLAVKAQSKVLIYVSKGTTIKTLDQWLAGEGFSLYMVPSSTVGLKASLYNYPLHLGGYYYSSGNLEITLKPNCNNYVYLERDKADYKILKYSVKNQKLASGFNRVCISRIKTNQFNVIEQEDYPLGSSSGSLGDIDSQKILGRVSPGMGKVETLTGSQVLPLLDTFGTKKGLVPGVEPNSQQYLRADGIFSRIRASDILPNFNISLKADSNLLELGRSIENPTFTATYNDSIKLARLRDSKFLTWKNLPLPAASFASDQTFREIAPGSISFTLEATSVADEVVTSSTSITWAPRKFWGIGPAGGNSAAFILGLSGSELSNTKGKTFTVNAGPNLKVYYAIPADLGVPKFLVGGFEGGFFMCGIFSLLNSYGVTLNYQLWESDRPNLGQTTVTVV